MKKITFVALAIFLSLTFYPGQTIAGSGKRNTPTSLVDKYPAAPAEAKILLKRVDEINMMDKSNLSSSEKKALQKEVRSIKVKLEALGHYVYVSVGVIVLVVILLIILL